MYCECLFSLRVRILTLLRVRLITLTLIRILLRVCVRLLSGYLFIFWYVDSDEEGFVMSEFNDAPIAVVMVGTE